MPDDDLPIGVPAPDLASRLNEALLVGPGLARVAFSSAWRVAAWGFGTYVNVGTHVVRSLASGQTPARVIQDGAAGLRSVARQALGLTDGPGSGPGSGPVVASARLISSNGYPLTAAQLRARGTDLLAQSADVRREDDIHPAYERILGDLAPDEARVLRFFATEGPQPSVDVRTSRPLGIGSELIASGMTMIGIQSGVRRPERTKPYLNNLYRLGLVWFSHESLSDPTRYQVLEVQPDVMDALKRAGRTGKTVRRCIELTPFGEDFCRVCLPLGGAGPALRP